MHQSPSDPVAHFLARIRAAETERARAVVCALPGTSATAADLAAPRVGPHPYVAVGVNAHGARRSQAPPETTNGRGLLERINRGGLGPLSGMDKPTSIGWIGATHWPDLYIVRPPRAPTTTRDIESAVAAQPDHASAAIPGPELFRDAPPAGGVPWYRRLLRRGGSSGGQP